MEEGAGRPGLFAKGGVGRFLLGRALGAIVFFAVVCGLPTLIATAVIGAGAGHYVTTHWDEIEAAGNEGTAFAEGRTITECVSEAQKRGAGCTDFTPKCGMAIGVFAPACVRAASDDGYCGTVPAPSEILPSTQWKKAACAASPGLWCEPVMGSIQSGCEARKEDAAKTAEDAAPGIADKLFFLDRFYMSGQMEGMADAAVLLRPLRTRILGMLAEPQSAAAVARTLEVARQKVGYHLKELEKQGLVELVEERKVGNCTERIVRATARAYLVSAEALGSLAEGAAEATDRFSAAYVIAVAGRTLREVAQLRQAADDARKRVATLTLETEIRFASAADRAAFAEELANTVARLTAKYHDASAPRGRVHRLVSFAYPKPTESV